MGNSNGQSRAAFFKLAKSKYKRCLAPGWKCEKETIRAHSVQNSGVFDLLSRNGHVVGIKQNLFIERPPEVEFSEIGRNRASTFTGFCGTHDTEIFRPIDTNVIDPSNPEHLFLVAYRSAAREMHANLESATRIQAAYQKRVSDGLDPKDEPSPAGLLAVQHMLKSFFMYQYMYKLDEAYLKKNYELLKNKVFQFTNQPPVLAASSLFSLDDVEKDEDGWVNVILNIFPISPEASVCIISYLFEDASKIEAELERAFSGTGDYQKYELSKLLLNYSDNFYIAPRHFEAWPADKVRVIRDHYAATILSGNIQEENQHFYLF